ncbi:MAG: HAMP domain-containing histidine kinase [Oscillospiraceae bacterium]|nr:HAMP domain-containing histidine kinase [Oscillospiraceae bacterium]
MEAKDRKVKTKLRRRILAAFSTVLFFSFLLVGVVFNFTIRMRLPQSELEYAILAGQAAQYGASNFAGSAVHVLFVLVGIMFVVAMVVTYFLSNSITRPIEQLGDFAAQLGRGEFALDDHDHEPKDEVCGIKELDELSLALGKSARQLALYDREQKTFFQNASHELRTPLMTIKCYAEGISFGLMEPKDASETILMETDRLSDLVTDLLYISKIDNITTAFTTGQSDLTALIRSCAERQRAVAAKRQIAFEFDFGENAITCECISELLSRAMDNLTSNAIRYARSKILFSCHKLDNRIELRVTDDGAGIDPEVLPHIFERFIKGKDGNHGIGLAIVKSIVQQHDGQITAENSQNGGAVFTITLPT